MLSRRTLIRATAAAAAAPALDALSAVPGLAQGAAPEGGWRHGLSLFGDLRYPPGFRHFEYVNPNAPKGGAVREIALGTFDNFNIVISGVKGNIAGQIGLLFNPLMTPALDEVTTTYGLIAEAAARPEDFSSVTYRLRPEARWHDGKPITPDDVIFSFESYKTYDPRLSAYYRHVVKAEKTGDREVTFRFDGPGNRELPQIVSEFEVMPKHWWEGTDANGRKRDISQTSLEPPLGCGPYRIKEFVPGRSIVYERVKDYWAKDLNVAIGQYNFDELRLEYFRDSTVALEAFKADRVDWRSENSAKSWATAYDFPAVRDGRVIKEEFPDRNRGIMQAFVFNIRRDKYADPRLRHAFDLVFDFEEMNKQIFFGQYHRINSYFDGTELACRDLPQGLELAILETVRDKVPPEVFTTVYKSPVGGSSDAVRANLREAIRLLKEAGYEVRDRRLIKVKTGEQVTTELLVQANDPASERIVLFFKPSLERLGVSVSVRGVDDAQYLNRLRQWDYDVIIASWAESLSPGNEQRDFWGSQAADTPGSRNYIGIKNPAVDAMIERIIFAKSREELVAATHALDRVLLWNHYVVPQWSYDKSRTARWDRFGRPDPLPKYGRSGFPVVWWWDAERAAKLGSR
jgi:microcin C transport system substrate-binding protein